MLFKSFYSEFLYEISFSDKVSKQAYLRACKWLAQNVYGKDEFSDYVTVKIIKDKKRKLPTFTVKLFITINEKEMCEDYCGKCKQLHTIFYSVDKSDCTACKLNGYRSKLHDNIKSLVEFWREQLENAEEG